MREKLLKPLDGRFGADISTPKIDGPAGFRSRRLDMGNGDFALFAWRDGEAFWLGNTHTPEVLWRTNKYTFEEAPHAVARWAQRELLAQLEAEAPWLAEYDHVAWYFLPVFFSKDGRETTRRFFAECAAGFPDATREEGLEFYDRALRTGVLDDHRYTMAAKLGTSESLEPHRMSATMSEFTVAKLLDDAGYHPEPEIELDSGYALDFEVGDVLVEVTRPQAPGRRRAGTPAAALRETASAKTDGQLDAHDRALLFVDCSSFRDDEWNAVKAEHPDVGHEPAVVFRARPDGHVEGYSQGRLPLALDPAIEWV